MSAEDVALVRRLQPGPEVDIAAMFREDEVADRVLAAIAPLLHKDFETVVHSGSDQIRYGGVGGLRVAWCEWTAPWATYRTEIEDFIDAGNRVVVLPRDFARLDRDGEEVALIAAAIWTVEDGKVRRAEFYSDRDAALRSAGLAD